MSSGRRFWAPLLLAVLLVPMAAALSGCWSRREINDLAIVSAAAIDWQDGLYQVTAEIFRPSAGTAGGGMGGGGGGSPLVREAVLATGSGPDLFSAVRELALKVPRRLYWAHATTLLVGEALARRGIGEVLDFWTRDPEARTTTLLAVTPGPAEKLIVQAEPGIERSVGREVVGLWRTSAADGHAYLASIHEYRVAAASPVSAPVVGALTLSPEMQPPLPGRGGAGAGGAVQPLQIVTLRLYGAAVMKHDRLVGWLTPRETRGWRWLTGRVSSTVLVARCQDVQRRLRQPGGGQGESDSQTAAGLSPETTLSFEVVRAWTQVQAKVQGGKPRIVVRIHAEGTLGAQGCPVDFTDRRHWDAMQAVMADIIRNDVQQALAKGRALRADVFQFGEKVHRADPRRWPQIQRQWDAVFPRLPVEVHVAAYIRRSGMHSWPPASLKP
ncbi:MAG: Ger(x)C family spore germination protein [Firmicutes bacterium]|nr:Ger(x)C family spore germination protein [Bacillota bacterium]